MAKRMKKNASKKKAQKQERKRSPFETIRPSANYSTGPDVITARSHGTVRAAVGHLNPLSEQAKGVKTHDSNSGETFTWRSTSRAQYRSDGTSRFYGWGFNASPYYTIGNCTTPANSTGAWESISWTPDSTYDNLIASTTGARLVSWGVRVYCTSSYDKASGTVILATRRTSVYTTSTGPPTVQNVTNAQILNPSGWLHYVAIPLKDLDHVWVSEKIDATIADQFVDPTASIWSASAYNTQWTTLCVFFLSASGAAAVNDAGASFGIEVVKNYEAVPLVNSLANSISSPAAVHDPRVAQVVNKVHRDLGPVHKAEGHHSRVLSAVGEAASAIAADAISFLAPRLSQKLFGRGANYGTPMIVD